VGVNEKDANKRLHAEADGSVTVRGIADKGLEGDVKYAFEKNGMSVADPVWVIHTGRAPGDDRMAGTIMMAIGVALAGLFFSVDSYKKRKNAAMRPVQIPA
jgi:Pyruvate/2-oxoacid:ferredoxin oxidoreductase gamma subunit